MEKDENGLRAKFWVERINHYHTDEPEMACVKITLKPTQDDSNADWSHFPPMGEISLTITRPAAVEQFQLGRAFTVDLTPTNAV